MWIQADEGTRALQRGCDYIGWNEGRRFLQAWDQAAHHEGHLHKQGEGLGVWAGPMAVCNPRLTSPLPPPQHSYRVRSAKRQPGVDEILLPGERGNKLAASRLAAGSVPIEPNLLASLRVRSGAHQQGREGGREGPCSSRPTW